MVISIIIENDTVIRYTGRGGDVVIPDRIKEIGGSAFRGCKALRSVNIPGSVCGISGSTFSCCTALNSFYNDEYTKIM